MPPGYGPDYCFLVEIYELSRKKDAFFADATTLALIVVAVIVVILVALVLLVVIVKRFVRSI